MIKVRVSGDVRPALRKLKKLIEKDGLMKEIRKHEYYEKPSEQRRRSKLRKLKAIRKQQAEADKRARGF